jgi:holo-[acyl-carrier protein] synthase
MIGIGLDLCQVERIENAIASTGFLERYYTPEEQEYIKERGKMGPQSAAAMFAAKEAFLKAIGSGIDGQIHLSEIGVIHDPLGAPRYQLNGAALKRLHQLGGKAVHLTLTHENGMAAAVAIIE